MALHDFECSECGEQFRGGFGVTVEELDLLVLEVKDAKQYPSHQYRCQICKQGWRYYVGPALGSDVPALGSDVSSTRSRSSRSRSPRREAWCERPEAWCEVCEMWLRKDSLSRHLKGKLHKDRELYKD